MPTDPVATAAYKPGDENVPGTFAYRVRHLQPLVGEGSLDFRNGYYAALADVLAVLTEGVEGD